VTECGASGANLTAILTYRNRMSVASARLTNGSSATILSPDIPSGLTLDLQQALIAQWEWDH
jgi:hypothetical protein